MNKQIAWTDKAWEESFTGRLKALKRINNLIKDVKRDSFAGIGKPEPLRESLSGFWPRRIDDTNSLVYAVDDVYSRFQQSSFLGFGGRPKENMAIHDGFYSESP